MTNKKGTIGGSTGGGSPFGKTAMDPLCQGAHSSRQVLEKRTSKRAYKRKNVGPRVKGSGR